MQFLNDLLAQWGNGQTPWARQQMEAMTAGGMPQMPVAQSAPAMASLMGGMGRAAQPQPQAPMAQQARMPAPAPQMPQGGQDVAGPSFGTYAAGALRGASQADNPIGAILGAVGGALGAGQTVDESNQTYRLLVSRGVDPAEAALAIKMGPQAQAALLRDIMQRNRPPSAEDQLNMDIKRAQLEQLRSKPPQTVEVNGRLVQIGPDGQATEIYAAPTQQTDGSGKTAQDRAALAQQYGLDPNSDAGRAFILTGKLPREDQQMLTATDKKAILEADEIVMNTQAAIENLNRALQLSSKAYDGATANERAWITSQFGSEAGNATRELNQAITETALQQLKAIFGGAPTEGERKILLEIQGSAELPQAVRDNIIRKAITLAQRRLEFNMQRANQLRGGTFYKPQAEGGQQPAPSGVGGAPIRAQNANGDVIEFNGSEWVPVQ